MKEIEAYAYVKFPVKGNCPKPALVGHHRCGRIPVLSLLDGGISGDICKTFCLECGKEIKGEGSFVIINQPNQLQRGDK